MFIDTKNKKNNASNWKTSLAILSLMLSIFIWIGGLLDSLQRPSVANNLELRRLELSVLGAPSIPQKMAKFFSIEELESNLSKILESSNLTDKHDALLKISLLTKSQLSYANHSPKGLSQINLLKSVHEKYWISRDPKPLTDDIEKSLLTPLRPEPLLFRVNCEILKNKDCRQLIPERRALLQIFSITIPPIIALGIGSSLVIRQIWLNWQSKNQPLPILVAPSLNMVDMILLVSGGFVTLGETVSSALVVPLTQITATFFQLSSPLKEATSIVLLYLGLTTMPLLILILMLNSYRPASPQGFLQLHWKPLKSSFYQAGIGVLSVCPLVVGLEQLSKLILYTPSGSNPLMTLLLNSHNSLALAFFSLPAIVLAPLFEELIFRGVLLPTLGRKLGPIWGIILSSFIFGIAHLSLGELAPLMALGLGLGWLRVASGRLAPCILMHSFWNSFTVINLILIGY